MDIFLQATAVALLALGAALAGWRIGRAEHRLWWLGFAAPMAIVCAVIVTRYVPTLNFVAPFSWLVMGRRELVAIGVCGTMALAVPVARHPEPRLRVLAGILGALVVGQWQIVPFLAPLACRDELLALRNCLDEDGVCIQGTSYTCGPAAAVTALRALGVEAHEGELAIEANATPVTGTAADTLCEVLEARYGDVGVRCRYRSFDSVDELDGSETVLAVIKHSFLVDHWVTVLRREGETLIVADPEKGLRRMRPDEFAEVWRACGVVVSRDGFLVGRK